MTTKFQSKKVQVSILIGIGVIAIGLGAVFFLNQKGYFSSQAATLSMGPQCPTKCQTPTYIETYVYNKTNNNAPMADAKVYARTTDCNRADDSDRDTNISWNNNNEPLCTTNENGYCRAVVCGGGGNFIRYYVNATKTMGNRYFSGDQPVFVPVSAGGTGTARIYGTIKFPEPKTSSTP